MKSLLRFDSVFLIEENDELVLGLKEIHYDGHHITLSKAVTLLREHGRQDLIDRFGIPEPG